MENLKELPADVDAAPSASHCSGFLRGAIESRLSELRNKVALHRGMKGEWRRRWYWDESENAQEKRFRFLISQGEKVREAEAELKRFIAEHRHLMGEDWIGNDHGRLCFLPFLGGRPIDQHYCDRPEGHDGFCENDKGSWTIRVSNQREWRELREVCEHPKYVENGETLVCAVCGKKMI